MSTETKETNNSTPPTNGEEKKTTLPPLPKVEEGNSPYPAYTIEEVLPRMRAIADRYGIGAKPAPRKDVCVLLGKAEATLVYFFGTTIQYGLLTNVPAKGVVVTHIFQKIIAPVFGEEGKKQAMIEAFGKPPLYKKLIEEFNNKILPNEEGLINLLKTKEYGINSNSVSRAVKVFMDNGQTLDIIDSNNRLRYLAPAQSSIENDGEQNGDQQPPPPPPSFEAPEKKDPKMFELPIDLGSKTAYLKYPRDIDSSEIDILKIMLDATLTALQTRQKKSELINKPQE